MLQADSKIDPLVVVLRLAYRRGLAIRQEQSKEQPVNLQEVGAEIQVSESKKGASGEKSNQTGLEQ